MNKLEKQQRQEFKQAFKQAETPLIEPNEEEKRNGWTAETLTAYVQEQTAARELKVDPMSAMNRAGRRPTRANSKYNPHRWR